MIVQHYMHKASVTSENVLCMNLPFPMYAFNEISVGSSAKQLWKGLNIVNILILHRQLYQNTPLQNYFYIVKGKEK